MKHSRREFLKALSIGSVVAGTGLLSPRWVVPLFAAAQEPHAAPPISAALAKWAAELQFRDISAEAVYAAKRLFLDSVGCALGGYRQHDSVIALKVLKEIAAPGLATIIGTGQRIDPCRAALVNSIMVRCLDYNDIYWRQDASHPSDIFPAAIACAERAKGNGQELITGLVLGHELAMRFCEAGFPGVNDRGWHHSTLTAFVSPAVAGRMLHLSPAQIQNAIGISASRITLGVVAAGDLTMMKNTADPLAAENGVFAALLAETGYTGPQYALEGKAGLVHNLGPKWKLEVITDGLGKSWRIVDCGMKLFPTEALTHSPLSAVLEVVQQNDIKPDQIQKIVIRTTPRTAQNLADPSKYNPQTKETADHSLPYCIAVAIVDRKLTPEQFSMNKINDPVVRAQLPKVEVVGDPEIEKVFPALQRVQVTITTTDGRALNKHLDYPKGDRRNPLSDREIEQKFAALAHGVLSPARQKRVIDAVWSLDKQASVSEFMKLLRADQ